MEVEEPGNAWLEGSKYSILRVMYTCSKVVGGVNLKCWLSAVSGSGCVKQSEAANTAHVMDDWASSHFSLTQTEDLSLSIP